MPYVRERFFKGETFIDLEDVARRALVWCREVAGGRIHGTTRRVPREVFEAQEKPALIPLQSPRFDPPVWAHCKVHPDHHVRFGLAPQLGPHALDRWPRGGARRPFAGAHLRPRRADQNHPRQAPGDRSTDYTDYPEDRAAYARRWPDYYCRRARELGPAAGDWVDQLLAGQFPWSRLRQAQKLLRLAERYGAARLEAACRRALDFQLLDVHRLQRILELGLESQTEPPPTVGHQASLGLKFLRPADHFSHSQGGSCVDPA